MKQGRSFLMGLTAALFALPLGAQTMYNPDAEFISSEMPGFGGAVITARDYVLVGEAGNQIRPGAVHIYGMEGGSWSSMGMLNAADGASGDGFGSALAASGDHLLISSSMGVHHFHWDGSTWTERGMVEADGAMASDGFGASIAMDGDWAVIGAPAAMDGNGAAFLFQAAGGWSQVSMIGPDAPEEGERFGSSVAMNNGAIVIGAPFRGNREGAAFVFEAGDMGVSQTGMIQADDIGNNGQFGTRVWIGDVAQAGIENAVIVSAPAAQQGRGTVRLFGQLEGEFVEGARIMAFDPMPRMGFGNSIAYTGDAFLVGATGPSVVYRFPVGQMGLEGAQKIRAEGIQGSGFGSSIAVGDGFVAVGAGQGDGAVAMMSGDMMTTVSTFFGESENYSSITGNSDDVSCSEGMAEAWECSEVDLVSFLSVEDLSGDGNTSIRTNDNWGWTDSETGKEYALIGMTDRLSMVDMSDPYNPVVVGILPMTDGARGSSWRDVKVYMDHAFVVSDGSGQHGMQVFDLTRLRDFAGGDPVFYDEDALYTNVASVHNIVINEESGFAYSVGSSSGGESCGGGLHMIDIRDPKNPTFAGCFADPETGRASTGYSHDAQCVMYRGPDPDYQGAEICLGSNETAISIADVTDKSNPVAVSRAAYPNPGYTHQGWLTDDHRFFFVNDELDELSGIVDRTRTIIWDLTDLDDPQLVAEHLGTQESSDHNLYIQGNLMYQSNYQSGLRILDVADPANPVEVAYFDTVPYGDNGAGFGGSWSNYPYFGSGVVLVTSGQEGMFLVRPTVRRTVFE